MLARKYRAVIENILNPFDGIYTLTFKSEGKIFKFYPGQFLHLAIDADYDGSGLWPESRCFSMQSAPVSQLVSITYAVKGAFTSKMSHLKIGDEVWLKLPYGDLFTQKHRKDKAVFIAGGTGITPFLSLFGDPSFADYSNPKVYLGFRNESYNIYHQELSILPPGTLKIFYEDLTGRIDANLLVTENGRDANYFISGPPAMIQNLKASLINEGVPGEQILTDDWE